MKKCVERDGEDEGNEGSTLAALPPRKKLCTCCTGDWEGHSLDWCRNPRTNQPISSCCTHYAVLAHKTLKKDIMGT